MKRLLLLLALIPVISFAQTAPPPPNTAPSPTVWTGQMLNTANTYVGSRLDTITDATAKYFYTCKIASTGLPVVYPLFGKGSISFGVTGIKVSGTPVGSITLEESFDGTIWYPVRISTDPIISRTVSALDSATYTYTTPSTFSFTNIATVQAYSWDFPIKSAALYYRFKILGVGTQTSSWRAFYCFNKN